MSTQMSKNMQEEKKSSKKVQPQSVTRLLTLFAIVVVIIAQSVIVPVAEARYLPTRSNVDQLKRQEIKEILRLVSRVLLAAKGVTITLFFMTYFDWHRHFTNTFVLIHFFFLLLLSLAHSCWTFLRQSSVNLSLQCGIMDASLTCTSWMPFEPVPLGDTRPMLQTWPSPWMAVTRHEPNEMWRWQTRRPSREEAARIIANKLID